MLEGLFLTWDKGFREVEAECDNTLLVELLLYGGGEIRIRHIPRTLNSVADHMTKCVDTCSFLIRLFRFPSALVMNSLGRDCNMSVSS
ncbi:hypothetical protein Godav_007116 [Gossypium davidsonii]|uniref:RNase H type-1 domain-containing protein n=2 Tax=Gossypium TaxID=3633 RepID=A0A7J8S7I3_GOSDV|nr:hypothetical protein [Gossypium davidsonii]MBA0671708.1 hypothetical protein [Gossypium klotzschianum]